MAEITLGGKRTVKSLKVNIGDKSYSVPLSGSLTIAEAQDLKDNGDGFTFFEKYIPKNVVESLTMEEFRELSKAWKQASEEDSGVELGE